MKKIIFTAFVMLTALCSAQQAKYTASRLLIKFKRPGIQAAAERQRAAGKKMIRFGISAIDRLNAAHGCIVARPLFPENKKALHPASLQGIYVLTFSKPQNIKALIKEYMATGELQYAQPDYEGSGGGVKGNVVPNDAGFYKSWSLNNNGSFVITGGNPVAKPGADIKMECGWGVTTGDSNVTVAVLDCGCQRSHPEFAGRIWKNPSPGSSGYTNDLYGWDFAYNDSDVYDVYGHGTNVAGIIGANGNNSIGYAGMNWKCKLMIIKVLDNSNSGYTSWWASGVVYAADNGANIINMSLESQNDDSIGDPTFQNAIDYAYSKGVLVVACMGNFDDNIPVAPADMSHVMAVGATTTNDQRAVPLGGTNSNALPGSCYNTYISVVAPGDEIYGLSNTLPDSYTWYWFGTSQACPHVVGLASLMLAVNPKLSNDQLRAIIEKTADKGTAPADPNDSVTSWNEFYGYGRINACRALDSAVTTLTGLPVTENKTPSVSFYPNPFNDKAQLVITGLHNYKNITIALFDLQGREIKHFTTTQQQIEISREGLTDGLYFYIVTSGQTILGKGKFIVTAN